MSNGSKGAVEMTAGLDLGDKYSHLCLLDDESCEVIEESGLRTTPEAMRRRFDSEEPLAVAIEVGEPARRGWAVCSRNAVARS